MSNVINLRKVRKAREKAALPPAADTLSFISRRKPRGSGFHYWDISLLPDDHDTGVALAAEYLAYVGANPTNGNATLLGCIVREMVERGEWNRVSAGFLHEVNRHAMGAARLLYEQQQRS